MTKLLNGVQEACERTGIGRSTMFELMSSGRIESVKVGKRRLIPEEALEDFVARLRAEQSGVPLRSMVTPLDERRRRRS